MSRSSDDHLFNPIAPLGLIWQESLLNMNPELDPVFKLLLNTGVRPEAHPCELGPNTARTLRGT